MKFFRIFYPKNDAFYQDFNIFLRLSLLWPFVMTCSVMKTEFSEFFVKISQHHKQIIYHSRLISRKKAKVTLKKNIHIVILTKKKNKSFL